MGGPQPRDLVIAKQLGTDPIAAFPIFGDRGRRQNVVNPAGLRNVDLRGLTDVGHTFRSPAQAHTTGCIRRFWPASEIAPNGFQPPVGLRRRREDPGPVENRPLSADTATQLRLLTPAME